MSRQDEILGLHPINHHVIGEWLDYEDKEPVTHLLLHIAR